MNAYRLGFWFTLLNIAVDFGQAHQAIPGLSHLKLGAVSQVPLVILVMLEFFRLRWVRPVAVWKAAFLAAVATGLVFGITQGRVLMVVRTEILRYLTGFLGLCLFVRTIGDLRTLHRFLMGLALVLSLYTILHGGHGPGLYRDENDMGLVLVMLLPAAYLMIFNGGSLRRMAFCLAIFLVNLAAIAATDSRGAMVGCLPTLAFCWFKSRYKVVALGLGAAGVVAALILAPPDFLEQFRSISDTTGGTAGERRYFWQLSVELFKHRPVLGVGAACWVMGVFSGMIQLTRNASNITPHSVYFQLISELGLVGTFAWMGFLATVFMTSMSLRRGRLDRDMNAVALSTGLGDDPVALRRLRADKIFLNNFSVAATIGVIGFLICGAFLSFLYYPALYLFGAMLQATQETWKTELAVARLLAPEPETAHEPVAETA